MAKKLQEKGIKGLKKYSPKNIDEARRMVVDGLREEREAIGINKNNKTTHLNMQDNPMWQTRFGQALLEMNSEQLCEVVKTLDIKGKQNDVS